MATHGGDIYFDIKTNKKPFEKGMNSLNSSVGKIGGKIGAKFATAFAAAFSVAAITKITKDIANLGDTIDKNSQKMGISAQGYQKWGYVLERCGSNIESMKPAMKKLAIAAQQNDSAFQKLGISQEEVASMNTEELFGRTITALQKVENGTERTYLASKLLSRGSVELGAVFNASSQETQALFERLEWLGGTMSDTAVKNSAALVDAWTDVKYAFRGVADVLATYVLPVITAAFNNVIIPAIVRMRQALEALFGKIPFFKKIKEAFGKQTAKEVGGTANAVSNVGSGLGNAGKAAKKTKKNIQDLKKELMGFDQITKLSGESGTSSDTGTSNNAGTGSVGGSLGDLDTSEVENGVSNTVSKINDLFSKIKLPESLLTALGHLKDSFSTLFGILADAGKWAWDNVLEPLGKWTINEAAPRVVEVLASAVKVINEILKTLGVILEPIWEHLLKPIAKALGDVFLVVLDALKVYLDFLAAALKVVKSVLDLIWEPLIKPLCDFLAKNVVRAINDVKDAIEFIGKVLETAAKGLEKFAGWIQTLPEKWANFKKNVKDFVLNIKIPTWNDIKSGLDTLLGKIWEKIRSGAAKLGIDLPTWAELKQKISDLINKFKEKIKAGASKLGITLPTWSEFKDKVAQLKEKFKNAFSGIKSSFSLKFSTAVGDLKSWINSNLIDKINSKFKKIPILKNHSIPYLAQGGYVKANTPQLAMIGDNRHEGEIVAPESKLAAMAAQAAASNNNNEETNMLLRQLISLVAGLDLSVNLDGESIKNNTVSRINRHTRATGQLEIII